MDRSQLSAPYRGSRRGAPASRPRGAIAAVGLATCVALLAVPLPRSEAQEGLVVTATGTGRTTGHIATLSLRNPGDRERSFDAGPALIPSEGQYQPYIVASVLHAVVPAGGQIDLPVTGYCTDIHRPPVPAGSPMPPVTSWIRPAPLPAVADVVIRPDGPYRPVRQPLPGATVPTLPGTDRPIPFSVDANRYPAEAAPFLLAALSAIQGAYDRLAAEKRIATPFSASPEKEREAVIQQTFWIYAAALQEQTYAKPDFAGRLQAQYEQKSGQSYAAAPPPVKQNLEKGAAEFWDAFTLVGTEAKVLTAAPAAPVQAEPPASPAVPVEAAGCTPDTKIEHTPAVAQVVVASSYGTPEERAAIVKGIQDDVIAATSTYRTGTPPATAFALWRTDHVGGSASAYAKTVFLKQGDKDWVWSTDPLTASAAGTGTHTLSFAHGNDCTAVVVGVALMRLRASSEAFDPLANSIEVFRVLDAIKDIAMELSLKRVPAGVGEAIEAGVDAATDPASETYAVATGGCSLTVGARSGSAKATSRVDYRRADKENKAITGGQTDVQEIIVSDVQPDTLTATVKATVTMQAGASGNGYAKSLLESLYGTAMVGTCNCPGGTRFEMLSDMSLFMKDEAAEGYASTAKQALQKVLDGLGADVDAGTLDLDAKALRARLEKDLKKWADEAGNGRFRTVPAPAAK